MTRRVTNAIDECPGAPGQGEHIHRVWGCSQCNPITHAIDRCCGCCGSICCNCGDTDACADDAPGWNEDE